MAAARSIERRARRHRQEQSQDLGAGTQGREGKVGQSKGEQVKDRISHGGSGITVTEYEVRNLDEFGDAQDVIHFPSKAEALDCAARFVANGASAAVVEKHTSRRPACLFADPDTFAVVAALGNTESLELWGLQGQAQG